MERTKNNKKVSAILTSDWHLREDTPVCFTGDFQKEQWDAVQFISDLQIKYDCSVIHAGDLYHHWKPSPWLLSKTIEHLPNEFYTVLGNHDLPQHNMDLIDKCGVYTLMKAGKLTILSGCHYGQEPDFKNNSEGVPSMILNKGKSNYKRMLVWHHMTYLTSPFPGASGGMAEGILRKYPQFDLILVGDNHQSFTIEYQGRRLVNPGNLTRQVADQINFKPCVWLWYAEDNSVKQVFLPIQSDVISREHIEEKALKDNRISAFIKQLNGEWDAGLTFEINLEEFKKKNNIRNSVMEIVYKSLET